MSAPLALPTRRPARAAGPPRRRPRATPAGDVTAEAYLRSEETAAAKHEWFDGEVREMPGVSIEHALLVPAVEDAVAAALPGLPFVRLSYDLKIRVPDGPYCYCDGVWCVPPPALGPPVRPGGPRTALLNPAVIVEVLSDSAADVDRGEKLDGYRTIPSLRDYLLFRQDAAEVEHYFRPDGGDWEETTHGGRDATLALAAGGAELHLGAIYSVLDGLAG